MPISKVTNNSVTTDVLGPGKNLIINGAMQVAQRGDVTGITGSSYGGPDRFKLNASSIGTFTISQSSTAPTGFKNSWKVDCTTADASPASSDLLRLSYRIEGQDLQQLAYGTSGAKAITLSFYIRSNKTGTYNVQFQQIDNSFKQAVLSYTIDSADTWEFKSITVPGDTSGLINDDNGDGLALFWVLGAGSNFTSGSERSTYTAFANGDVAPTQTVNLADSTSNEWLITGVQLEVGEQATPFEHRSFAQELDACRRFFVGMGAYYSNFWGQTGTQIVGVMIGAHQNNAFVSFKTLNGTQMRATPTAVIKGTPKLTNFSANQQNLTAAGITSNHTLNFTYDGSQRTALEHIAINAGDSGAGFGLDAEL